MKPRPIVIHSGEWSASWTPFARAVKFDLEESLEDVNKMFITHNSQDIELCQAA